MARSRSPAMVLVHALFVAWMCGTPLAAQQWADAVLSRNAALLRMSTDEQNVNEGATETEPGAVSELEPSRSQRTALPRYTLADLETRALTNHPALAEVSHQIEAAKGRRLQAGLRPNPTVGYTANEIGNQGSAGQQGVFVGQQFVRGGKLQLARAVECREVDRLTQEWNVIRQRLLTDIRSLHLSIIWLQHRQELYQQFIATNARARSLAEQLFAAGDSTKTDLLLAEIEYEQTATELATIEVNLEARWRELARVLGDPMFARGTLDELDEFPGEFAWEEALARMQQSPQLVAIHAELARNQAALARARVEPIPNISAQISVQYDFGTEDPFTGFQVGMPIPVNNRNQGAVYAATAEIRATMQRLERMRLEIERQLARKYGEYQFARQQLARIERRIIPKAREVVRIALQAYQAGEVSMADALNAQRSLLRALLQRLEAERQQHLSRVAIEGYLLSDALALQVDS